MSKILITGNGFDLFHHLPTKYGHFMAIMKTIEEFKFDNEVSFDDLFGRYFKDEFSSDYDSIEYNYKIENIRFYRFQINELAELVSNNKWYNYFKTVLQVDTWIDFENEVENILNQLSVLLKSGTFQIRKDNNYRDIPINYSDFNLFGIIEHKFDDREVFSISDKYVDKRKLGVKSVEILNDLSSSFEDFIIVFNQYLVDIVMVFYKNKKTEYIIPFHLINEIYTFNYTPTLENIYEVDGSKVIYLHGKINKSCKIQNLVFGVDEISQDLKTAKAYSFTKYYQKIKKNTNVKFIKTPTKNEKINETIFYIMGHSLDESDKEYITDLFKFLEADFSADSKICLFYYSLYDKEQKIKNLFNIIDKKIIIEMNKCGRLYFVELNIENINSEFNRNTKVFQSGWS